MGTLVYKDGKWVEGKAEPKLLREELRRVPGELITTDIEDKSKVHEEDAAHIIEALVDDAQSEPVEEQKNPLDGLKCLMPGESLKFTTTPRHRIQWEIDVIRFRVVKSLIDSLFALAAAGIEPDLEKKYYIWFPENEVNHYELREGNPPANIERPKYLRGYDLWIDITCPPKRIKEALAITGVSSTLWEQAAKAYSENN